MFIRNIQMFRLTRIQNSYRFFSTTKGPFHVKQEEIRLSTEKRRNAVLPIDNQLPTVPNLPSYLPEPIGVKSKLFDNYYLVYRFGFHRVIRYIQILKLSQTFAT